MSSHTGGEEADFTAVSKIMSQGIYTKASPTKASFIRPKGTYLLVGSWTTEQVVKYLTRNLT